MTQKFYHELARVYDTFVADKPYDRECSFVTSFLDHSGRQRPKLLELGCGTGNHLCRFQRMGFQVTGLDKSSEMLRVARKKCGRARLIKADMLEMPDMIPDMTFDLVVSLGTVIQYLPTYGTFEQLIESIRSRLRRTGLFAFDLWKWSPCEAGSETVVLPNRSHGRHFIRAREWEPKGKYLFSRDCFLIPNSNDWNAVFDLHKLRLYRIQTLDRILSRFGFESEVYGDFQSRPLMSDRERAVFICRLR